MGLHAEVHAEKHRQMH